MGKILRKIGPWTHHAHVAAKHIEELRQLIELPLAQRAADASDARVSGARHTGAHLLAPVVHGAELKQLELVPVAPAAPLPEQDRPWRTKPDGNSNARHQRQGH